MRNKKWEMWLLIILALLVLAAIFWTLAGTGEKKQENKEIIGFIMTGNMKEAGWNGKHYTGIRTACENYGAELLVKENVKEFTGQCETAIRELAEEGASMIFLSSYGYSEEVGEVVKEYPEIVFYANSSEHHDKNMTSYFIRIYQARYLAGMIAGLQTQSNCIGYVAAMPNNEVNRGINAFTLGVHRVNQEAEVLVYWTDSWDDKERETEAANKLIEEGADVLTYHQNQPYTVVTADSRGVDSIGYHEAESGFSPHYLTSVIYDWNPVYEEIIRSFLQQKGNKKNNFWIGLEKNAVGLSDYSELVSEESREEVEKAKEEIKNGKAVFSGTIYDNTGKLRCAENEIIQDEILLEQFDWYVEGVSFYEE